MYNKFDFNHNINKQKRQQTMDTFQFLFGDIEEKNVFCYKRLHVF